MSFCKYRSPALQQFWVGLKEVGVIMSLIKSNTLSQKNISALKHREISESLCRSAILLLCSNTEKFFESIIVDILNFHESNSTPIDSLPLQLKVIQVLKPKFAESWSYWSVEKNWSKIEEICDSKFTSRNEQCELGLFTPEIHTRTFASPKSNNVEKLFSDIGIEKVWERIDNDVLKRGLDSFVSRRDVITHEGLAVGRSDRPTAREVGGFIKDICEIALTFNKTVSEYLAKEFKVLDPWLTASHKS